MRNSCMKMHDAKKNFLHFYSLKVCILKQKVLFRRNLEKIVSNYISTSWKLKLTFLRQDEYWGFLMKNNSAVVNAWKSDYYCNIITSFHKVTFCLKIQLVLGPLLTSFAVREWAKMLMAFFALFLKGRILLSGQCWKEGPFANIAKKDAKIGQF